MKFRIIAAALIAALLAVLHVLTNEPQQTASAPTPGHPSPTDVRDLKIH